MLCIINIKYMLFIETFCVYNIGHVQSLMNILQNRYDLPQSKQIHIQYNIQQCKIILYNCHRDFIT